MTSMDARGMIIRDKRLQLGLKMKDLAERADLTEGTISRIEAGKMPNASLDTWIKVCEALDLDLNELKPSVLNRHPARALVGA